MARSRQLKTIALMVISVLLGATVVLGATQITNAIDRLSPSRSKPQEVYTPTPFPSVSPLALTPLPTQSGTFEQEEGLGGSPVPPRLPGPNEPYEVTIHQELIPDTVLSTRDSDLVIQGIVTKVYPARWTTPDGTRPVNPFASDSADFIYTPVQVDVKTFFKRTLVDKASGSSNLTTVMLMANSGTVGQDSARRDDDLNTFKEGDLVVLFLRTLPLLPKAVPVQEFNNLPMWRVMEHYTIDNENNAFNTYRKVPLGVLVDEVEKAVELGPNK